MKGKKNMFRQDEARMKKKEESIFEKYCKEYYP